jgi:transporter family protein
MAAWRASDDDRRKRRWSAQTRANVGEYYSCQRLFRVFCEKIYFWTLDVAQRRSNSYHAISMASRIYMNATSSWVVWALLSAVFAALTAIFAKVGIQNVDSDFATFLRTIVVVFCLGLFVAMAGKWSNPFDLSRQTLLFLTLSALATAASWMCYFRALQMGPASQVAPIDKFSLVLVAVFAFAFLGERPSLRDWCGIGLVAVGVIVLSIKR